METRSTAAATDRSGAVSSFAKAYEARIANANTITIANSKSRARVVSVARTPDSVPRTSTASPKTASGATDAAMKAIVSRDRKLRRGVGSDACASSDARSS